MSEEIVKNKQGYPSLHAYEQGIWCVGERLRDWNPSALYDYPQILLPYNHLFTKLVMRATHCT